MLLEGPAGIGKTALLQAARGCAERAGFTVLTARGGELERELGSGIARQLFEPLLVRASQAERARLLRRPAAQVARLFGLDGGEPDASADEPSADESSADESSADEYGNQNALYWLCARLAEPAPMMIAIDDLQWCDATSLGWLAYLMRRLEDLPILMALAWRTDEPSTDVHLLAGIAAESSARAIRPAPLSMSAVLELTRDAFDAGPHEVFVRACHEAAGGNPLFTLQLLAAARGAGLAPVAADAEAIAILAPERVSQLVLDRLRRCSAAAVSVAECVAVLGTHAEVRHVRALSALSEPQVLDAGDELAAAGLLRAGQSFEFIHPVIWSSVYGSLAAGRRAGRHERAARLLRDEGAAPGRVAVHLLKAPPAGERWAVEILRSAAAAQVRPETRVNYLRRAVAEPMPAEVRAEVLVALGQAESLTHDVRAVEHLREALRLSEDPGARATAAGQLAYCLLEFDRADEAEPVLRAAIARLSGGSGREPLVALHASLLQVDFRAGAITAERLNEAIAMAGEGHSPAERDLLRFAAYAGPSAGVPSAEVAALARRALMAADLTTADGFRLIGCPVWALEFADRLDEADHWLLRIQDAAQRRDQPGQFMLAASARAMVSCRRGALADAEQDARVALDLAEVHGRDDGVTISAAALVIALTEQGRLTEADAAAAGVQEGLGASAKCDLAVFGLSLGWLRLAQGRATEAASEFQAAARVLTETGHDFPGFWPWRTGAAAAELALGRRSAAGQLARAQLRLVRPFGAPGLIGIALRAQGLAEGGTAGLALLAAACEQLDQSPALLDRAKAHLELGAALRRAGKRTESRQPLRLALDLADRCGAVPVAERAREEILANGGRPRRIRISGVEALTASELRVARRAGQGRTNREIAQELFVTTKAVEKHLASAYRKLDIDGRGDLAGALGAAGGGAGSVTSDTAGGATGTES